MTALLLFLAQLTIDFVPQSVSTPGGAFTYAVGVCSQSSTSVQVSGASVMAEGLKRGLAIQSHGTVRALIDRANRLSPQRKALIALEVTGWLTSVAMMGQIVQVKEKWRVAIPVFSGIIRMGSTVVKREFAALEMPADYLPPLLMAPPCPQAVQFPVWAVPVK